MLIRGYMEKTFASVSTIDMYILVNNSQAQ